MITGAGYLAVTNLLRAARANMGADEDKPNISNTRPEIDSPVILKAASAKKKHKKKGKKRK